MEKIVDKHKNNLAKTKEKFGGENAKFSIIVAKRDIENISKLKINLLIDFLKHIKKISSKIIHFNGHEGIKIQKEIFYNIISLYNGNEELNPLSENGFLKTDEVINIIFNPHEIESKKEPKAKINKLNEKFDFYISKYEKKEKEGKNEDKKNEDVEIETFNKKEDLKINELFTEEKLSNIMAGEDSGENINISNLLKILKKMLI